MVEAPTRESGVEIPISSRSGGSQNADTALTDAAPFTPS